ncbi:hypothetical protein EMPG_17325 [Blastomyces silverae]|uniref:Uncharacterized protein n=1 Tax=Blastomyces silverae TaxID=2060906 RepID=A0A0H1B858_9EURO|nr:hypothetical protein EMPG_17325 [Blastomyces silverae]
MIYRYTVESKEDLIGSFTSLRSGPRIRLSYPEMKLTVVVCASASLMPIHVWSEYLLLRISNVSYIH